MCYFDANSSFLNNRANKHHNNNTDNNDDDDDFITVFPLKGGSLSVKIYIYIKK